MIYTGKFKRAQIYHNTLGETPEAIKAKTGCTAIINGILFNADGSLCCDVRIDGKWIANDQYTYWGLGWSGDNIPKIVHTNDAGNYDNFLTCVPVQPDIKRGRSAVSFTGDTYTVVCVPDGSGAMTIPEVEAAIGECDAYLVVDGGGSAYCDCPGGKVDTTLARKTANRTYILIWEDKPVSKKKVCLDPGHGLKEAYNQSPDGTYKEYEFTLDMGFRLRGHLQRCGLEVMMTREDDSTPGLTARATMANNWGADLFVSLHSNADNEKYYDSEGWGPSSGFTVWIYDYGGERERAAKLLIEEMKAAGVKVFGQGIFPNKSGITVLKATNMPAILPEYLFHTNRTDVPLLKDSAYREKMAVATAKAIVAWCGAAWVPEAAPEPVPKPKPEPETPGVSQVHRVYQVTEKVQMGAFNYLETAEAYKKTLESQGMVAVIVSSEK